MPHPYDTIDPVRDIELLEGELLLNDLVALETRLERIENEIRNKGRRVLKAVRDEGELLASMQQELEAGGRCAPVR